MLASLVMNIFINFTVTASMLNEDGKQAKPAKILRVSIVTVNMSAA